MKGEDEGDEGDGTKSLPEPRNQHKQKMKKYKEIIDRLPLSTEEHMARLKAQVKYLIDVSASFYESFISFLSDYHTSIGNIHKRNHKNRKRKRSCQI